MATAQQLTVAADPVVGRGESIATPFEELTNYRLLVARVVDVFGDEAKASVWLSTPNSSLKGETPLRVAEKAHYESLSLEPLLTRIEHGIYL